MGFSGVTKPLSDMQEQTTASDNDYMPIGGADLKKIKLSNLFTLLKEKLGINELNRNLEYVNIQINFTASSANVVPCTGIVIKDKVRHTLDMHLNILIETWNDRSNGTFNMDALKSACGVSSMSWHPIFNTRVVPENIVDTNNLFRGRTGLHFVSSGYLGRAYALDLSVFGGWSSEATLYTAGCYYHIDVWGASYT